MEEVFASIDDDHGVIGSLQSRGLIQKTQKELLMLVEKNLLKRILNKLIILKQKLCIKASMMSKNFSSKVLIDCFHYGQSRGISIYTNNLIDNINSNPHLKNIKFYLLVNKKLSIDVISKNIKVIKLPKLNIIVWEQLVVPLIAILYRADKVHYLGNTFSPFIKSLIVSIHDVSYLKRYKYFGTDKF